MFERQKLVSNSFRRISLFLTNRQYESIFIFIFFAFNYNCLRISFELKFNKCNVQVMFL